MATTPARTAPGRRRPAPTVRPWPTRPSAGPIDPADPDRPTLRLLRWPGTEPGRPRSTDGSPKVLGRLQGYPLELRVWPTRAEAEPDAVFHPSGNWVSIRLLDA